MTILHENRSDDTLSFPKFKDVTLTFLLCVCIFLFKVFIAHKYGSFGEEICDKSISRVNFDMPVNWLFIYHSPIFFFIECKHLHDEQTTRTCLQVEAWTTDWEWIFNGLEFSSERDEVLETFVQTKKGNQERNTTMTADVAFEENEFEREFATKGNKLLDFLPRGTRKSVKGAKTVSSISCV